MGFIQDISKSGIQELQNNWKEDIQAGFLVFLVSLPLSLGVAMACNLPPFTGILTSIIGGVFISLFQGSAISIKSPAAGLIVIITASIAELGQGNVVNGYKLTLAIIVLSGVIQMILGSVRVGILVDFFPSTAVHGMLAAIGIMIISKQLYNLIGVVVPSNDSLEILYNIPYALSKINPEIFFIGLISILILLILPSIKYKFIQKIPAPMAAVLLSIPIGHYFDLEHFHKYLFWDGHEYLIGPSFLVTLPSNFSEGFTFPDFDKILSLTSLKYIFLLTFVGSIESLVSTKAIDNLEYLRRRSDINKDLFAIGLGNTMCGLLGGLPMITEIIRSSSNSFNGAKTYWAAFFNGFFMLAFVLLAPGLIHQIPLSALAAMLIYIGFKLASPRVFIEIYKIGFNQFLIMVITIIFTLAGNILLGMIAGILMNILIHLIAGVPILSLFKSKIKVVKSEKEKIVNFIIYDSAIFSNYLYLKNQLDKVSKGFKINIDFTNVKVLDHTFLEHIHNYGEEYISMGGTLNIEGLEHLNPLSSHPLSFRIAKDKNAQESNIIISRKKIFKEFAKEMGFKYLDSLPLTNSNFGKIHSDLLRVKYERNILYGKLNSCDFRISDLSVLKVGDIKPEMYQLTIMSITGFHKNIPEFSLNKENLLDRIKDNTIFNDIDFPLFPKFSNTFKLSAINEMDTREFFNDELIKFLENEKIYHIESFKNEIIVYKTKTALQFEEVKNLLEFGLKLGKNFNNILTINATTIQES